MARNEPAGLARVDILFASGNFWQPGYKSYPYPPDKLEELANRVGISDAELRSLLVRLIEERSLA